MPRAGPTDDELRWFFERYAVRGMPFALQEWNRLHPDRTIQRTAGYEWLTKFKALEEGQLLLDQFMQQLRAYTAVELLKGKVHEQFEHPETELKPEVYAQVMRRLIRDQVEYAGAMPKVPVQVVMDERVSQELAELEALRDRALREADEKISRLEAAERNSRKDAS